MIYIEKKLEIVMSERDDLRKMQKRRTLTSSEKADLSLQIADKTKTIKSIRYKLKLCADLIQNTDHRRQALNEELEHERNFLKYPDEARVIISRDDKTRA